MGHNERADFVLAIRDIYALDVPILQEVGLKTARKHYRTLYNTEKDGELSDWLELLEECPEIAKDMLMPIMKGQRGYRCFCVDSDSDMDSE